MKLEEVQRLFANCDGQDAYCIHYGNRAFADLLALAKGGEEGACINVGEELVYFQNSQFIDEWRTMKAVFRVRDTFFSIEGDCDSWDGGVPDYTTPYGIRLVKPVEKVITVYEEVHNEN